MKVKAYKCNFCNEIIYSRHFYDRIVCDCYSLVVYENKLWLNCDASYEEQELDLNITKNQLEKDFIKNENLFGRIRVY